MSAPPGESSFYRGLVSHDTTSKQPIGQGFLAGTEMQGIKGAKFQEDSPNFDVEG